MKILFLSFYYSPDYCAGSFRNEALVNVLAQKLSENDTIEVITTMPNRYGQASKEVKQYEEKYNIIIHRIPLLTHQNSKIRQIIGFSWYWLQVYKISRNTMYDGIYASSSRLFTGFMSAIIAYRRGIPLYLDIRDIFTDGLRDVYHYRIMKPILSLVKSIELFTISKAHHLNLVSAGFRDSFNHYAGNITYFTNGIDEIFLNEHYINPKNDTANRPLIITYAGNIGDGQGLEKIIPEAAKRLGKRYHFNIIGDGGTKQLLVEALGKCQVENVTVMKSIDRKQLKSYYQNSDYLFFHLNNYPAFEKVLPSKIFEYAATHKPIIAGVKGYPRVFIQEHVSNSLTFNPCDVDDFVEKIKSFEPQLMNRDKFIEDFKRSTIMNQMAESIIECLDNYHTERLGNVQTLADKHRYVQS